jgi:hypothetical protein
MSAIPERKRGRPFLVEGQETDVLHVRLPEGLHSEACRVAIRAGVSVSEVVRLALTRHVQEALSSTSLLL